MVVTVVTVCRNNARTIAETLRSVAQQSYGNVEHLVIDGASTDGTTEIVRRHGAARLVCEPDAGIYDAMNKGIRLATGDAVGFLNADDTLADRDVIARIASALGDASVDAAYGDLVYVADEDAERVVRHWRAGAFWPARLRFGWMAPHPTLYVRAARLRELGGFDTRLRIAADYDLMLRLFGGAGFQAAYVPSVLVRMRLGGASNGSVSGILRKSQEDLGAMRAHGVGGLFTLACKNLRKVPQFDPLAARRSPVWTSPASSPDRDRVRWVDHAPSTASRVRL